MSKLTRRRFFGGAAAVSVAVAVPARAFVRTFEDRSPIEKDPIEQVKIDYSGGNAILRLYHKRKVVVTRHVYLKPKSVDYPVLLEDPVVLNQGVVYGRFQNEVFENASEKITVDDCSVEILGVPGLKRHLGFGGHRGSVTYGMGSTLTLEFGVDGALAIF